MENLIPQLAEVKDLLDPARVVIAYERSGRLARASLLPGAGAGDAQGDPQPMRGGVTRGRCRHPDPHGARQREECSRPPRCPDVDGFLVGGASLKPEFAEIVAAISKEKGGRRRHRPTLRRRFTRRPAQEDRAISWVVA